MNALNPVLSIGAQLTDVLQAHVPGQSAPRAGSGPQNCWRWSASPPTG